MARSTEILVDIPEMAPPPYASYSHEDLPLPELKKMAPAHTGHTYRDYEPGAPHDPRSQIGGLHTAMKPKEPWYKRMVYMPRWYHIALWSAILVLLGLCGILAGVVAHSKGNGKAMKGPFAANSNVVNGTIINNTFANGTINDTADNSNTTLIATTTIMGPKPLGGPERSTLTDLTTAWKTVTVPRSTSSSSTSVTPKRLTEHCDRMYEACPARLKGMNSDTWFCKDCLRMCKEEGKLLSELSKDCFP